ncbi:hypothetical protein Tco_0737225 [Tanacetum coccineum]
MRTRNSYFPNNSPVTIPRRRNRRRAPNIVEPEIRTIVEVAPMADNRTMEELLQAPTEGYGEAIVIPEINADHFEIKTNLLQLVQANPFHGFERENPHTHINNFKRITSTLKFRDVPNDVIKLMMFPYSLEGAARVWLHKVSSPDGNYLVVYMLVERRYPLSKELLQQMLDLGLEIEEESTAALQLNYLKEQTLCKLKMAEQDIPPPTITAMKIPIIRKGEYDIWSMRMRQYICHTDHNLWDVIVNGDLEEEPAPTGETSAPPAPKTAKQLAARRN